MLGLLLLAVAMVDMTRADVSSLGRGGGGRGGGGEDGPPQPYQFEYSVVDAESGNNYGQQESSDGNTVTGEFHVLLPDGRNQVVKYTANDETGFVAEVTYDGQPASSGGGGGGAPGGGRPGGFAPGGGLGGTYLPPNH